MENLTLLLIVSVAGALGFAWYVYLEQQARLLRTRVLDLPGGLRFEAHGFWVELQQSAKQIQVHAEACQLSRTALAGGAPQVQQGPLEAVLPAPGLQVEVTRGLVMVEGQNTPVPGGLGTITFTASDALTNAANKRPGGQAYVLTLANVPEPVAVSFQGFANRVNHWAEKITFRLQQDSAEQLRLEEEGAKAALEAQLLAEKGPELAPESEHEDMAGQIAKWRKAAGYSGDFSDVSTDAKGRVIWFIDFCADGRITLHANNHTIYANLRGARIATLGSELEIWVRDEYWSEEDPRLSKFIVLQGLPPDERRAWKERLEKARDALDSKFDRGY